MAAFTGTGGADTADAAAGLLTGFTGGTLALLQDLIGDSFNGLAGDDYISAGAGDDTIVGGAGIDSLFGNGGSDLFQLANGDFTAGEMIDGGSGDDTISLTNTTTVNFSTGTLAAIESLIGSGGNDSITMSAAQFAGFSTIDAGSGTDTVTALFTGVIDLTGSWPVLTGIERLAFTGSAGNDTLVLTTAQFDAATVIDFGAGNDTLVVLSSLANFVWQPLVPTSGLNNLENVTVIDSDGSNTLGFSTSTRNFNVIANGGDDSVTTYNGNDTVNGGTGNDTINTLGGTDTAVYAGPLGNFSVTLNGDGSYTVTDNVGNEGVDILRNVEFLSFAGVTYAISSLLPPPSATFTGTGGNDVADYLNGILTGFTGGTIAQLQDSFADTFIGSDGNDTVIAGNGADTIIGGPGADYLLGREGADLFIYYTGDAAPGEYVHGDTGLDTILATGTVDFYGSSIIHIGGLVTGDAGCDLTIQNDHDHP
jgi:Ca2+-binding RTX toxin-like protein